MKRGNEEPGRENKLGEGRSLGGYNSLGGAGTWEGTGVGTAPKAGAWEGNKGRSLGVGGDS